MVAEDINMGVESGAAYVVNYDESQWLEYDEEGRQFCKDTWIKQATPMPGIKVVVLRLHPDTLFPIHGNEKPYIAWQHKLEFEQESGFTVERVQEVKVYSGSLLLSGVVRSRIMRTLQPGAFRIYNVNGQLLDSGRL